MVANLCIQSFSRKSAAILAAILDFSDRTMISADHPRFSCTSDMSLTIYGKIFSGPLVHTNDPSGTVLQWDFACTFTDYTFADEHIYNSKDIWFVRNTSQRAHDVKMKSDRRRCDVMSI